MTLRGRRVLITGAGGFIGSHLVEEAAVHGADVRAFVRYTSRGDEGNLAFLAHDVRSAIEVVAGDVRDPHAVLAATRGCDVILNLAALIAIPYSYVHPREVIETNVIGTLNVLDAARAHDVGRIVQISTSEVYGTAQTVPISETHALQGQSPYSASKIGADRIAESYHRSFGIPVVIVRPFNTFGPRQSARAVIPSLISQALTCDRIKVGSLTPTRDFTYVGDTVRGMRLAAETDGIEGQEINLGNGQEVSIGRLVEVIQSIIGTALPTEADAARMRPRDSEVQRLLADNSRALALLGWAPTTTLRDGLAATVDWVRTHPERFDPSRYQT